MALQNLRGITKVHSFDDFMGWYNRQLYLEQQAEDRFQHIGVKIGGKNYKIKDAMDIPQALRTQYVDYWKNDFTEEQRREMWLNLGLSPSNYNYIQTWKAREEKLAKNIMAKIDVINEDNMKAMERNKAMGDDLAGDADKPDDQKMGEKQLLSMMLEVQLDTNRALREGNLDNAEYQNLQYTMEQENVKIIQPPRLSESYGRDDDFGPISDE